MLPGLTKLQKSCTGANVYGFVRHQSRCLPFLAQLKGPHTSPDEDTVSPSSPMPPRASKTAEVAVTGNAYTYSGIQPASKSISMLPKCAIFFVHKGHDEKSWQLATIRLALSMHITNHSLHITNHSLWPFWNPTLAERFNCLDVHLCEIRITDKSNCKR